MAISNVFSHMMLKGNFILVDDTSFSYTFRSDILVSKEDPNMMEEFRNTTKLFTPAFSDPTVMIVNKKMKGDMKIEGFGDLLNPALKDKIAFGDPVNSSSAFQSLVVMLYDMGNGDPFSKEAWDYCDKF